MERREFLKLSMLGVAGMATGSQRAVADAGRGARSSGLFVGVPVLPEYLCEQGVGRTLDAMREIADIRTVMTFSHDHVFRQYRAGFTPKVDAQGRDLTSVWVRTDPNYYARPEWQGRDNRLYAGRDILDELEAEARPRGMEVYARILEPYAITGAIPGFEAFAEIDANGETGKNVCFNHPDYIGYWHSVIEDLVRSHPSLAGFKFGQERGGPMLSSMGKARPGTCFCPHCLALAEQQGLRTEEARRGLIALQDFGNRINAGEIPVNGRFVEFLSVLGRHSEVLAWERFWMESRENQRKRIYRQIKQIHPAMQVGWHIDHGMTWDLITRAFNDYRTMGPYSDWLSVAVYFDSMGRRSLNHYEQNYKKILFGDADEKYSYPMYLSLLGYDPETEPSLEAHRQHDTAFSSEYVYRECKRAVTAVNGAAKVYARPGFDMPGYDCQVTPRQVYQAVTRALEAGVDGLWCGREWDEIKPESARAFGDAVRDWNRA